MRFWTKLILLHKLGVRVYCGCAYRQQHCLQFIQFIASCIHLSYCIFCLLSLVLEKFPYSGQNVGMVCQTGSFPETVQSIYRIMFQWFNQYEVADASGIEAYRIPREKR